MIRYLLHGEIDKPQWDACIERSVNRLPYAASWWLDVVSPGWEALILDDYRSVMPLTWHKKLGIYYLYQPYLTQQLGIFSTQVITPEETGRFLAAIPGKFRYTDIHLNTMNNPIHSALHIVPRNNYTLELSAVYPNLAANYHRNCRRNIQKAIHSGLYVKTGPGPSAFTAFVERNLDKRIHDIKSTISPVMHRITQESLQKEAGEILGVYKPGETLVAAGWFLTDPRRCVFVVCASTREGKENQAMYLLVDYVIRRNAGSGQIFDFTGSNMPGVAYFNAGFGATKSVYPAVKKNSLPWILRLIKR